MSLYILYCSCRTGSNAVLKMHNRRRNGKQDKASAHNVFLSYNRSLVCCRTTNSDKHIQKSGIPAAWGVFFLSCSCLRCIAEHAVTVCVTSVWLRCRDGVQSGSVCDETGVPHVIRFRLQKQLAKTKVMALVKSWKKKKKKKSSSAIWSIHSLLKSFSSSLDQVFRSCLNRTIKHQSCFSCHERTLLQKLSFVRNWITCLKGRQDKLKQVLMCQ